jgi:hypothetical protein
MSSAISRSRGSAAVEEYVIVRNASGSRSASPVTFLHESDGASAMTQEHPRRSMLRGCLYSIVLFAILQSITVTPPLTVCCVDKKTNLPVAGLQVVGVWRLHATTLAGDLQSSVLKVQPATTDEQGHIRLGTAVMVHQPVMLSS